MGLTTAFSYKHNQLCCEELTLSSLGTQYGTPLYVYSKQAIEENCKAIESAFAGQDHLSTYAVKANGNIHILRLIAEQGLGADVGSRGELFLALKAGFPPDKISFSGVGKRDDEIEEALDRDILAFNVESEQEIEIINSIAERKGRQARILLRLNLDIDAHTHAYISTSKKENKFGVPASKAEEILKKAQRLSHIEIRGIHSHIGSQITSPDTFVAAASALRTIVEELRVKQIPIHDLDFGGGFGVQYHGVLTDPQLPYEKPETKSIDAASLIKAALPILKETGCNISIQPGRSVIANAGALLTKVLYRKETDEKTFIIVDGGMNDLIRPSLYQAHHQIVPTQLKNAKFESVDVVGPCCESGDFFATDRALPHVVRGDDLVLLCTGAYGLVLSSNYNARLRPAEILVDGNRSTVIREREQYDELLE